MHSKGILLYIPISILLAIGSYILVFETYPAGLDVSHDITYYDLRGNSPEELYSSMREVGPIAPADGQRYMAVAFWDLEWKYRISEHENKYRLSKVGIELKTNIVIPRRNNQSSEDPYATEWKRYVSKLRMHEYVHADIANQEATKLYRLLSDERTFETKKELLTFIEISTSDTIAEIKKRNHEYDQETKHGKAQGASLREI